MSGERLWDVVVLGGVNSDYLARGPSLPRPGATVEGDEFQAATGGKGANQAVAAARLGARVALLARVGDDDRGREALASLQREGVDTRYVSRDPDAATGVALVQVSRDGEKQILSAPGANRRLGAMDVRAAEAAVRATSVLLANLEAPADAISEALRLARAAGARTVLDPAPPRSLPDQVVAALDVIRPNSDEAEALTGIRVRDRDSAREAARALLRRGAGAAAVQAGDNGNLLVWPAGEEWLPKLPVRSIDSTGAGDAFAAALAVALAAGRPLPEAARLANAAAALATTKLGAQAGLPRRQEVLEMLGLTAG